MAKEKMAWMVRVSGCTAMHDYILITVDHKHLASLQISSQLCGAV